MNFLVNFPKTCSNSVYPTLLEVPRDFTNPIATTEPELVPSDVKTYLLPTFEDPISVPCKVWVPLSSHVLAASRKSANDISV